MIFRSSIHFQDLHIFTCPLSRSPDLFHSSFATSLELPILFFLPHPIVTIDQSSFFWSLVCFCCVKNSLWVCIFLNTVLCSNQIQLSHLEVCYSPGGCKELDTTEWLHLTSLHFMLTIQDWFFLGLTCLKIKAGSPKGNQPQLLIGRTDAEAPILWLPDAMNWLWKRP